MKRYRIFIEIAFMPFIILCLFILKDYLLELWIKKISLKINVNYYIIAMFFPIFYAFIGALLAYFYNIYTKFYTLRLSKLILLCNTIVLTIFLALNYFGLPFSINLKIFFEFLDVKEFSTFTFLLIGYNVYLLVYSIMKRKNQLYL